MVGTHVVAGIAGNGRYIFVVVVLLVCYSSNFRKHAGHSKTTVAIINLN